MLRKMWMIIVMSSVSLLTVSHVSAIPIAGGSSGIFTNPTGPPDMITTGVGTSTFTWGEGDPSPSSLRFIGNPFSVNTGDPFSFGTLGYFNGTIFADTEADSVDLRVTLTLTTPAGISQNFIYTLGLINTDNTGDPLASADIVNFPSSLPNTFFTTGGVNYTLEFLGFGTIVGSGFSTVGNFHVLEGGTASAQLLGRITPAPTAVPEPSTILLLAVGLMGFPVLRRGNQRI